MRFAGKFATSWQKLELWKSNVSAEFRVEGAVHAWFHRKRYLTGLAWDLIAAGALLGTRKPESILMLGLAGGTAFRILRHLLPDARLTAVDIDPDIIELAREHMELDHLGIEIHISDAYEWMRGNERKFDVVIDDIYLAGKCDVFRPFAWDEEIVADLRQAMALGGILAVNLVTGAGHRKMQSFTRRLLTNEFPAVATVRTPGAQNEVLVTGETIGSGAAFARYGNRFVEEADRKSWAEITTRKLR